MVSLALVGLALLLLARRFFSGAALVDQVLGVAIVLNIALFVLTSAGSEGPHEIAVVAPFGAALAARMLAGPRPAGARAARRAGPPGARRRVRGGTGGPGSATWAVSRTTWSSPPRRRPSRGSRPGCRPITCAYGLGGYWESSIVTVQTDGQVKVRALLKTTLGPDLWLAKPAWYDPARPAGQLRRAVQHAGLQEQLGAARPDQQGTSAARPTCTTSVPTPVMVWDRNILSDVPR